MSRITVRRFMFAFAFLSLVLGVLGIAQTTTGSDLLVVRTISTACALPESQFLVTLHIEAKSDLNGVGIEETLPYGWKIHPLDNAGAAFKLSQWTFAGKIKAGTKLDISYEVTIPPAGKLYADTLPECFSIKGISQSKVPAVESAVTGDDKIQVESALPVISAIAHLIPASKNSGGTDTVDLRLGQKITREQLARAIELWRMDSTIPWTRGETISIALMEKIVAYYETCTPVDQPLPVANASKLQAVRTITTFLPSDTVLLPHGCFDPGPAARRFVVTVEVTAQHDAYGVGLKEWLPIGWHITPLDNDGFIYRPSHAEWVYAKRLAAGEKKSVIYQVEVARTPPEGLDCQGCCGQDAKIVGTVSSDLGCGEHAITGEDTIHIWQCLPVMLAISRWDVSADSLDVTLSNNISFPQVQRAIAFWQQSAAVPYTCGYTVGYETLKTLVAHWLTDTPVTENLPGVKQSAAAPPPGSYKWFCAMKDEQGSEDRAKVMISPVKVDAGVDQQLTCNTPVVTLIAKVSGGSAPYTFLWEDADGNKIGGGAQLQANKPGTYTVQVRAAGGCVGSDSVVVTQDIVPPTVDAGPDQLLTCAVTSVTLAASVSGGTPPYTYVWTDSAGNVVGKTEDITIDQPSTYTLTVTGANGCSASDSAVVTQDIVPPTVDAGPDQLLTCAVTSIALAASVSGGTPPYTYVWTDSAGDVVGKTEDITVDQPSTYTLTVTGANGCSASDSVTVSQDIVPPTVDAGPDQLLTCAVTSVTLAGSASGGTPPYAYVWTDSNGNVIGNSEDITVNQPDTYTLTATGSNGCSASDSVTVAQDIRVPTVVIAGTQTLSCTVTSVTLAASVSGGTPPYTYVWTDSAGNVVGKTGDITVDQPSTYTLTVIGANGCSASDSAVVTQDIVPPTVDAGPDQVLTCANTTAKLDATVSGGRPPYTYTWQDSDGKIVGCTEDVIVDQPGTYILTVTGLNGCQASDSVTVNKDITPPTVAITASALTLTCLTDKITLKAEVSGNCGKYTYNWQNSHGDEIGCTDEISVDKPGTYTVTVTGTNGCSGSDSAIVTQDIVPPTVDAGSDQVLTCAVTSVTLAGSASGGTPPYAYVWTDSNGNVIGNTEDITVDQPDTYTLTATGSNGCSASDSTVVTRDIVPPTVDAGPDQILTCAVTSVTLNGSVSSGTPPYKYTWVDSTGSVIGDTEDITVEQPGTYTLTATGSNGCSASDTVTVTQDICVPTVIIADPQTLSCTVTSVTLDASVSGGSSPYTYEWTDSSGSIVGNTEDTAVSAPDTYTLTVTGANGCSTHASVQVGQDIEPPVVNAGPDRELTCLVSEVTLFASVSGGKTPYLFLWRDERGNMISTEQTIVVQAAGTYNVTVVGANGCCASDQVVVTENTAPPEVDAGPDQVITCDNPEAHINATISGGQPPYQITWLNDNGDTVATTEDLTVTLPGVYTIVVTGANGCTAKDEVTVSDGIIPPTVDAGADKVLTSENGEVLLDATVSGGASPYTYRWTNFCGAVIGDTEDISVSVPGVYTLTVISASGCMASDSVEVINGE